MSSLSLSMSKISIARVQTIRKAALLVAALLGVAVFALTDSVYPDGQTVHEMIEWAGMILIIVCILGRTWTSLYIGGRKISDLVTEGPYSVTRNPLYFFSTLGVAGMGAQSGSIIVAAASGLIAFVVFYAVVLQEEKLLLQIYGKPYRDYVGRVPRFVPRRLWREERSLTIRPPRVVTTFWDAMLFLLAVPIAEGFEYLRDAGVLPVLAKLY